ncbi:MAG: SGNH/GDSL hydrolase family protein [Candidatus Scalindua sp.]
MKKNSLSIKKRFLFTIIAIFLSFLILLCLIEVIARVFFLPHDIGINGDKFFQKNDKIGWMHIPKKTGIYYGLHPRKDIREPKGVKVHINSKGLNDKEYLYFKTPKAKRILLLGDSMTEGLNVKQEESFQSLLEDMLNYNKSSLYKYEVINAGHGKYGTNTELLFFQNEGYKYNPDITILCIFPWNDIRNNSFELEEFFYGSRRSPFFSIDDEGELILNSKVLSKKNKQGNNIGKNNKHSLIDNFKQFIRKHLESYYLLSDIFRYRLPVLGNLLIRFGLLSPFGEEKLINGYPAFQAVFAKKWSKEYEDAWQITKLLILRMREIVQNNGSKFMVVIIPYGLEVHQDWWHDYLAGLRFKDLEYDINKSNKILCRFLVDYEIEYIDLKPHLIKYSKKSKKPLYFRADGHFNPNGHKVVSKVIYNWLVPLDNN